MIKTHSYEEILQMIPIELMDWPVYLNNKLDQWSDWVSIEYDIQGEERLPGNYYFLPSLKVKLPKHARWIKCPKCKCNLKEEADKHKSVEKFYDHLVKFGYCLTCQKALETKLQKTQLEYAEHQLDRFIQLLLGNHKSINGFFKCLDCIIRFINDTLNVFIYLLEVFFCFLK